MHRASRVTLLFSLAVLVLFYGRSAHSIPEANFTQRVSVRSNGSQANDDSDRPDISADGRYVAFASDATELVSGDDNEARDIFVHDRQTGITERVSIQSDGGEANFDSDGPSISDDGRYVAFYSFATNLRSNDTNGVADIFVHDRQTGDTELVNIVLGGQANDISYDPEISGNGQYITFWSFASNLVGGDNNSAADVFRFDQFGQTMFRVSLDSNGVEGNGPSSHPSISQDGRYIAFQSDAGNLVSGDSGIYRDVFWRDMNTGQTKRVSVRSNGSEANGDSFDAAISANGRYVSFTSLANDVTNDDNNPQRDIFLRVTQDDTTRRISAVMGNINIWEHSSVSNNGRYVTYRGRPSTTQPVPACDDVLCEIFVYDRDTGTAVRASVSSSGEAGNRDSFAPVVAANGRYIAFSSNASNLVPGDSNGNRDIFVRDYLPDPTLSVNFATGQPGSFFAFASTYYPAQATVQVWVNGVLLGNVTANGDGDVRFRLQSQPGTDVGAYFVTVQSGTSTIHASFRLDNAAPLRADTGSDQLFVLPDGIAFTHFLYLPVVR
jgi:Tol biopolymer transport system component